MHRVRALPAVASALLWGGGVGCGGEDARSLDARTVEAGAAAALERAARFSAAHGSRFVFRGSSTRDGETAAFSGTGSVEAGGRRASTVTRSEGIRVQMIIDGPFMLLSVGGLPGAREDLPPGTRWIKADESRLATAAGFDLGPLRRFQTSDPASQIAVFQSVGRDIRREGVEQVRGIRTVRYRLVVGLGDLLDRIGAKPPPQEVGESQMRLRLWLDRSGRPRRTRIRLGVGDDRVDVTSEVVAFERGLRIAVPSGRSVYDATRQLGRDARKGRDR